MGSLLSLVETETEQPETTRQQGAGRERDRGRGRQRGTERETEREREGDRDRQRQRERHRERETGRETCRQTEKENDDLLGYLGIERFFSASAAPGAGGASVPAIPTSYLDRPSYYMYNNNNIYYTS